MKQRGTTGAGEPQTTGILRVHRHLKQTHGRGTTGNAILLSRTSVVDTMSNDPRQYGDGRGEVIPSFDGTDFRQFERRVRLFLSATRVAPARRAGKLVRAFDLCEGIQDLETPNGVKNLLEFVETLRGSGWTSESLD